MSTVQTLQECTTTLAPQDVLAQAKRFFTRRSSLYATFLDREGPNFATFRGQGGEEIVIAVAPVPNGSGTRVTGSTYLFDMQIARFFTTLPSVASVSDAEWTGKTTGTAAQSAASDPNAQGATTVGKASGSSDSETEPTGRTRPGTVGNAAGTTATGSGDK